MLKKWKLYICLFISMAVVFLCVTEDKKAEIYSVNRDKLIIYNNEGWKTVLTDPPEEQIREIVFMPGVSNINMSPAYPWKYLTSIASFKNIETIIIEEGVSEIDDFVFAYCAADISVPSSLQTIGFASFTGMTGKLTISPDNPYYESKNGQLIDKRNKTVLQIFSQYKEVKVENGVVNIAGYACSGNHTIERITLPPTVEYIGGEAFGDCISLVEVSLPDSLKFISYDAFAGCSSLSLTIPRNVQLGYDDEDANYMFGELRSLIIMGGSTRILDVNCFGYGGMKYIVFIDTDPTLIDEDAFVCADDDFRIFYLNSQKYRWSPNGETEWNGIPIIGIDSLDDLPPVE